MNWLGHVLLGLFLYAVLCYVNYLHPFFSLAWLDYLVLGVITVLFSLLPDIDQLSSKISRLLHKVVLVLIIFFAVFQELVMVIVFAGILLWTHFLKHRGFAHSLVFCLLVSGLLAYFAGLVYGLVAFLSFSSHVFLGDL